MSQIYLFYVNSTDNLVLLNYFDGQGWGEPNSQNDFSKVGKITISQQSTNIQAVALVDTNQNDLPPNFSFMLTLLDSNENPLMLYAYEQAVNVASTSFGLDLVWNNITDSFSNPQYGIQSMTNATFSNFASYNTSQSITVNLPVTDTDGQWDSITYVNQPQTNATFSKLPQPRQCNFPSFSFLKNNFISR